MHYEITKGSPILMNGIKEAQLGKLLKRQAIQTQEYS